MSKLWFISKEDEVIGVFEDKEVALDELYYIKEDSPASSFKVYSLSFADLENYSDEYDLASSTGLIWNVLGIIYPKYLWTEPYNHG